MKRHGTAHVFVTDNLRSYGAAMKVFGNADRQKTGRWLNNWVENPHQLFRRREQAMLRFRRMRVLQKFVAVYA
jgi:putative transposase